MVQNDLHSAVSALNILNANLLPGGHRKAGTLPGTSQLVMSLRLQSAIWSPGEVTQAPQLQGSWGTEFWKSAYHIHHLFRFTHLCSGELAVSPPYQRDHPCFGGWRYTDRYIEFSALTTAASKQKSSPCRNVINVPCEISLSPTHSEENDLYPGAGAEMYAHKQAFPKSLSYSHVFPSHFLII